MSRGAWYLGRAGQTAAEPGVSQGRVRSHPGGGVPLQTPPDKVEEQRVVTAFEGGLELAAAGRAARLPPPRPPAVQHRRPVRQGGGGAVPRVACTVPNIQSRGDKKFIEIEEAQTQMFFNLLNVFLSFSSLPRQYRPLEDMKFFARFDWSSSF